MEIKPLGQSRCIKTDVKILAATNENLESMVKKNLFRKDLLQRLKGYEITLPPLRKRSLQEKEMIINHLLKKFQKICNKPFILTKEAEFWLVNFPFCGGNIRELKNTLQSMIINAPDHYLEMSSIPPHLRQNHLANNGNKIMC